MMILCISIVHYIACIVLIVVILLQAGRGHGLTGGGFGGDSTQSLFGTRTSSFMTKATSIAAIGFLITSLTLDIVRSSKAKSLLLDTKKKVVIPEIPQTADIDDESIQHEEEKTE